MLEKFRVNLKFFSRILDLNFNLLAMSLTWSGIWKNSIGFWVVFESNFGIRTFYRVFFCHLSYKLVLINIHLSQKSTESSQSENKLPALDFHISWQGNKPSKNQFKWILIKKSESVWRLNAKILLGFISNLALKSFVKCLKCLTDFWKMWFAFKN